MSASGFLCAKLISSADRKSRKPEVWLSRVQSQNAGRERKMRKDLTELVFILDKSGSMQGLEADTVGGYNSMLEKQKKDRKSVV